MHAIRNTLITAVAIVLLALTTHGQDAASNEPSFTVFTNVNVISMSPADRDDPVHGGHVVVVRDDRIAGVYDATLYDPPRNATFIDGEGGYLIPGLADMHVHVWDTNEFPLYLANGVTTVRNMWGSSLHLGWQEQIEKGSLTDAPTIYTAGAILDGVPPIWPGSEGVDDVDQAIELVRKQHEDGYQFVKVYNRLTPEVYDAIMTTAEDLDMPVVGHVPNALTLQDAVDAGQVSVEHLSGFLEACVKDDEEIGDLPYLRKRTLLPHLFDGSKLPGLVQHVKEGGLWNCPTLIVYQKAVSAEDSAALLKRPEMRYVSPFTKNFWNPDGQPRTMDAPDEAFLALRRGDELHLQIVKALHESGAPIILGSDTPNPYVVPGFSIHEELANLVSAGLSPYDALATGTVNASRFLQETGVTDVSDRFGVIEPGRRADLVLLERNPLDDIAHTTTQRGVMVRGKWTPQKELQIKLDALAANYETLAGDSEANDEEEPTLPESDVDRFAEFAALPTEGSEMFTARYVIGANDQVFGEERVTMRSLDTGTRLLAGQATFMPFSSVFEYAVRIDADDALQQIAVTLPNGSLSVDPAGGGGMQVTGVISRREVKRTIQMTPDLRLRSQGFGFDMLLLREAKQLDVGESNTLQSRMVAYYPSFQIVDETITLSRKPDEQITHRGEKVDVQVYGFVTENEVVGESKSTIYVDEKDLPVRTSLQSPMGTMHVIRAD